MLDWRCTALELKAFVEDLLKNGIILSIISSKTEKEIIYHLEELGIEAPFAAENGCLVSISEMTYEFGTKANKLKNILKKISKKIDIQIELFSEMEDRKIEVLTGLPEHLIKLSKFRKFSQPFIITKGNKKRLIDELNSLGYTVEWGGRFYQISKGCSKGSAVKKIRKHFGGFSIGIGDSENDYSMLDECDYSVILNNKDCSKYRCFKGHGPKVWKKVVEKLLNEINE
jgi:mannosyl-3-phosphoglycerate phosphatase family protein